MAEQALENLPAIQDDSLPQQSASAERKQLLLHVAIILASGALFRLLYQLTFKPCWSGDTQGYATEFYGWVLRTYSIADRPPIYPLFLGLVQRLAGTAPLPKGMSIAGQYLAVILQSTLNLGAALSVYFSLRSLRTKPRFALAGGISFALIGVVCLMEMLLLSEALSLFFVTFGICLFLSSIGRIQAHSRFALTALLSGFIFSLAILTRPENLIFVAVLVTTVLLLALRCGILPAMHWAARPLATLAILLVSAAAPLVLCWMTWNLIGSGEFRINTLTGATRTESVYNLFDRVGPEDRIAGLILQQSYLLKNGNGQTYRHHVWVAMPKLLRAFDIGVLPVTVTENVPTSPFWLVVRHRVSRTFGIQERAWADGQVSVQPIALYDYLGALSGRLAKQYPLPYLRNVASNFIADTFDYSYPPFNLSETNDPHAPEGGNVVRSRALYTVTLWINRIEEPLLVAAYLVLLGFALASPWLLNGRSPQHLLNDGAVAALALAALATIVCCCVVAAYYPAHGVPFFAVHVICFFTAAANTDRILDGLRSIDAFRSIDRPRQSTS